MPSLCNDQVVLRILNFKLQDKVGRGQVKQIGLFSSLSDGGMSLTKINWRIHLDACFVGIFSQSRTFCILYLETLP